MTKDYIDSVRKQFEYYKLLGEKTYYAKVDMSLPERQKRSWEKKTEKTDNGGSDE